MSEATDIENKWLRRIGYTVLTFVVLAAVCLGLLYACACANMPTGCS